MVKTNKITVGDVYSFDEDGISVISQVGACGDCGIFKNTGRPLDTILRNPPLFRIIIVDRDLRKIWKKVGNFELSPHLEEHQTYAQLEPPDSWYLLDLCDVDSRIPTSEDVGIKHERFAFWATHHIVARLHGVKIF